MKLRYEYEIIRSNLMSRVLSPSLNECLNELLRKEQIQLTQHVLKQQSSGRSPDVAYAAIANVPLVSLTVQEGSFIITLLLLKDNPL